MAGTLMTSRARSTVLVMSRTRAQFPKLSAVTNVLPIAELAAQAGGGRVTPNPATVSLSTT